MHNCTGCLTCETLPNRTVLSCHFCLLHRPPRAQSGEVPLDYILPWCPRAPSSAFPMGWWPVVELFSGLVMRFVLIRWRWPNHCNLCFLMMLANWFAGHLILVGIVLLCLAIFFVLMQPFKIGPSFVIPYFNICFVLFLLFLSFFNRLLRHCWGCHLLFKFVILFESVLLYTCILMHWCFVKYV